MRISGESAGPDWESDLKEKRVGPCNSQHSDLGRPSSFLQHPHSRPRQWLAYLQSQDGGAVWPENSVGCRSAGFGISNEEPGPACPERLEAIVQRCSSSLAGRADWPQSKSSSTFWPGKYDNLSKLMQFLSRSLSFFLTSFSSRILLKYDLIDRS